MKKLLLLLSILPFGSIFTMDAERWGFTNTTDAPVGLRWYKTKLAAGLSGSCPWGSKYAISQPITLASQETAFIELPPSEGRMDSYRTRRELILTSNPALLEDTVDADNSGKLIKQSQRSACIVKNRSELDKLRDGAELLGLMRPLGAHKLRINPQEKSWICTNVSDKPIYGCWYRATWHKDIFVDPEVIESCSVFEMKPNETVEVYFPKERIANTQRQLLLSGDKALLTKVVLHNQKGVLPKGIAVFTKHDLGVSQRKVHVGGKKGVPVILLFTNLINVINTTNTQYYGAFYVVGGDKALKIGPDRLVTEFVPQLSAQIHYPATEGNVRLVVAHKATLVMQPEISLDDLNGFYVKDFSRTNLTNWYREGAFEILTDVTRDKPCDITIKSVGGGALKRMVTKALDIEAFTPEEIEEFESSIKVENPLFLPDKEAVELIEDDFAGTVSDVDELDMEQYFIKQRTEKMRKAINELVGPDYVQKGQKVPKIAFIFPGGGYRAMIETIGFLRGAAKSGILDCASYVMALSGSTWAINSWVASGLPIHKFSELQRDKVGIGSGTVYSLQPLLNKAVADSSYKQRRLIQKRYGQHHGPIGLYGHALTGSLLDGITVKGKTAHHITLSDLREPLKSGLFPLPISVAVEPGMNLDGSMRVWYEFSPYYIGTGQGSRSWINTKLFGSTFKNGLITHYAPEYPLAQFMGIWGAAVAVSPEDAKKKWLIPGYVFQGINSIREGSSKVYNGILRIEETNQVGSDRLAVAQMPNYNYRAEGVSPLLSDNPYLGLIDGGITKQSDNRHNFASIPALWREADVLIMCDSTEHPNTDHLSKHLLAVKEEADRLGYAFPEIDGSTIERIPQEVATLIAGDEGPVVVYMKGKKHPGYGAFDPDATEAGFTGTTNFNYSPQQYDALTGLTEHIMKDEETVSLIRAAIKKAVSRTK